VQESIDYYNKDSSQQTDKPTENNNTQVLSEISAIKVTASSTMPEDFGLNYKADNVNDEDLLTWWSPLKRDLNTSWIKIDFGSVKEIAGIKIHGGSHYPNFRSNGDIYKWNNRLTQVKLEFSDGSSINIELKEEDAIEEITFPTSHATSFIKLKPLKWLDGTQWKDICISYFKALAKK
jgi:hypothetical protein